MCFDQLVLDSLQVELGVAVGGLEVLMAQELADGREADGGPEALSGVGTAQTVDPDRIGIVGEGSGARLPRGGEVALEVVEDRRIV